LDERYLQFIFVFMQALSKNYCNSGYHRDMPQGRPSTRKRNEFGQRLHNLREAKGLTQKHMSEALGVTQQTYSELERTPVTVHLERLQTLAAILEVSIGELCGENPKRPKPAPRGKLNQVFEAASKLPRRQQQKILDVVEPFIAAHANS